MAKRGIDSSIVNRTQTIGIAVEYGIKRLTPMREPDSHGDTGGDEFFCIRTERKIQ